MLVIYLPGRKSEKSKSAVPNQKNQFDVSRKAINTAIDRLCEFTGKEIYRGNVLVETYCY
jgi:hypothetical protein